MLGSRTGTLNLKGNHEMSELIQSRPTWNDDMKNELSVVIGKQINEWCNNETDLEDCIESAKKVLEYGSNDNGFELAKAFEYEGFDPNTELCELLDGVFYEKNEIIDTHVKKWVSENNKKLELVEGQKVVAKINRKDEECEIVHLYPEELKYGVWNEQMGEKGKCHSIIISENIINVIS